MCPWENLLTSLNFSLFLWKTGEGGLDYMISEVLSIVDILPLKKKSLGTIRGENISQPNFCRILKGQENIYWQPYSNTEICTGYNLMSWVCRASEQLCNLCYLNLIENIKCYILGSKMIYNDLILILKAQFHVKVWLTSRDIF